MTTPTETPASKPLQDVPPPLKQAEGKGPLSRLYNWTLHWAYTPYALPALILVSFAESSFFPIPPEVLLLPMILGNRQKAFRFAMWVSIASVVGGMFGYALGYFFWESLQDWFIPYIFSQARFDSVGSAYQEWNFWIVFTAGFSPIPYKLFTVSGGVFHEHVDFTMFTIASAVSRPARFFLEAWLLWKFGEKIRGFVEKRLGTVAMVFCVVLVGGFVAVKYLLPHDEKGEGAEPPAGVEGEAVPGEGQTGPGGGR